MKRKLIDRCIEWKDKNSQVPFYLSGARGVGKTYLAMEFAKAFYQVVLYLNFETDPSINHRLRNLNGMELIQELYRYNEQNEKASFLSLPFHDKSTLVEHTVHPEEIPEETTNQQIILILDEISCCSQLDNILSSVIHSRLPIHILLINSHFYEPACMKNGSIHLIEHRCYPLDFEEFLLATSNEWYIGVINEHFDSNRPVPEIVHKELLELYDIYLIVGGMPEAVSEYLLFSNVNNIVEKHRLRQGTLINDIYTWQNASEALKMKQVMDTIPTQLQKRNKKFQYTYIRKGATRNMYEEAISSLIDTGYVIASLKMTDETQMKLYLADSGMLASMIRYNSEEIHVFEDEMIKSALLENSVAAALHTKEYELRFWESDSSAKVEFIIGKNNLLPIELFLTDTTRSKNLSVFKESYEFDYAVKISSKNFGYSKNIKYVPYYAIYCL